MFKLVYMTLLCPYERHDKLEGSVELVEVWFGGRTDLRYVRVIFMRVGGGKEFL